MKPSNWLRLLAETIRLKFINGVLGTVLRQQETAVVAEQPKPAKKAHCQT